MKKSGFLLVMLIVGLIIDISSVVNVVYLTLTDTLSSIHLSPWVVQIDTLIILVHIGALVLLWKGRKLGLQICYATVVIEFLLVLTDKGLLGAVNENIVNFIFIGLLYLSVKPVLKQLK